MKVIAYKAVRDPKIMWSGLSDDGTVKRSVGLHERAQEILACPNNHDVAAIGGPFSFDTRVGHRAVYLHDLLNFLIRVHLLSCCNELCPTCSNVLWCVRETGWMDASLLASTRVFF